MSFRNKPRNTNNKPMDNTFYEWLKAYYPDPYLNRNIAILKLRNRGLDYYAIGERYGLTCTHCGRIYNRYADVFDYLYRKGAS